MEFQFLSYFFITSIFCQGLALANILQIILLYTAMKYAVSLTKYGHTLFLLAHGLNQERIW